MKGIQSNGFMPIIAHAIAEMEELHGELSSIEQINLGEKSRIIKKVTSGITRVATIFI